MEREDISDHDIIKHLWGTLDSEKEDLILKWMIHDYNTLYRINYFEVLKDKYQSEEEQIEAHDKFIKSKAEETHRNVQRQINTDKNKGG